MAFSLELPSPLGSEGWKVKIRDKERLEPPHATIFHKRRQWRLDLRRGGFLVPPGGNWSEIDDQVRAAVEGSWQRLCDEWDRMYPTNPVSHAQDNDDG